MELSTEPAILLVLIFSMEEVRQSEDWSEATDRVIILTTPLPNIASPPTAARFPTPHLLRQCLVALRLNVFNFLNNPPEFKSCLLNAVFPKSLYRASLVIWM